MVFRLPVSVWTEPGALAEAQQGLVRSGQFTAVTGALDPDTGTVTPTALAEAHDQLARTGPQPCFRRHRRRASMCHSAAYRAYQDSAQFISADGRTILFQTELRAGGADSTAAAAAMPAVRAGGGPGRPLDRSHRQWRQRRRPPGGRRRRLSGNDLLRIIPIVMIVLALLLAIVLRSLVAPLYLVVSVGLSYLASLGLASWSSS